MAHSSPSSSAARSQDHMTASKPVSLVGMEPASHFESYKAVTWWRKQEFVLFPLFIPAMIVIALTGDIYCKATKKMREHSEAEVWRYTAGGKAVFVVIGLIVLAAVLLSVLG